MERLFDLFALLLAVASVFAWVNKVYFGLPQSIALMLMGLSVSILSILFQVAVPDAHLSEQLTSALSQVDFEKVVLNGMLAFLLFAGALHVDFLALRKRAWSIGVMASLGVLVSTIIVGAGLWLIASLFGASVPFTWALVFGVLISPTDPIAVLAILKSVKVAQSLEMDLTGESLFNDGVAVVIFSVLLGIATGSSDPDPASIAKTLAYETFAGGLIGFGGGYVAYRAVRRIDEYAIEVLISLALCMSAFAAAQRVGASGPIAAVVAGLYLGHRGPRDALSQQSERYLFGFWKLVDDILNSTLFLLIGLEVLVLRFRPDYSILALCVIPFAVGGRLVATSLAVLVLRHWQTFSRGSIPILTWGGLRGGISIALALALPETPEKPMILTATYSVVIFTIAVQGLTLKTVIGRFQNASQQDKQERGHADDRSN